ncbi:MAG: C40 family peptidase [Pseudomonadota bacterium]
MAVRQQPAFPTRRAGLAFWLVALVLGALGCAHLAPLPPPVQDRVLTAVEGLLGAPYRSGGMDASGVDCSGLTLAAYRAAGFSLPRSVAGQMAGGQPVDEDQLAPADLVFFRGPDAGRCAATHCGIYLGDGRFAHASSSRGVIISRLDGGYWRDRYVGARRYASQH